MQRSIHWTNQPNCRASHYEFTTLLNKCFVTSTEMMWCLPLLHFRPAFYRNAPVSLVKCKRKKLCQRSWVRPDQDRQLMYRTYFVPSPKKKKKKNSLTQKHLNSQPSTYVFVLMYRAIDGKCVYCDYYKSWGFSSTKKCLCLGRQIVICFSEKQRCKGIWILESEKFSLVECDILGIRTTAQGIRNRTRDWNPES